MENLENVDIKETEAERQAKIERLNAQLEKEDNEKRSGWFGLVMAVLAALAIRAFAFEPYNIPSSSMVPNLLVGDYLFITKFDYGYSRHSFLFSLPLIPKGRLFYVEPKRGDIVVFKKPPEHKTDYIKRIIGLPGDTIQLRNGRLFINNILVPREELNQEYWETEAGRFLYTRYRETLPNGLIHDIYELTDNNKYDETDPIVVPENHFFMMGVNNESIISN